MFVINPPWTLEPMLRELMPYLVAQLGCDAGAGFTLESGQTLAVNTGTRRV
jgi:23S rRNA (adenine2030-N6)-methyltransferase